MALPTSVLVNPRAAGVWIEGEFLVFAVCDFGVLKFGRITVVTNNAASWITHRFSLGHDLVEHLRSDLADRRHFRVTFHATRFGCLGKVVDQTNGFGDRFF